MDEKSFARSRSPVARVEKLVARTGCPTTGVLPSSFAEATIFRIPKTTTPTTGLDYRPIALLNSDYKIYSRLLLQRVRAALDETLSPAQFGFAPGRQVHDAIDVWTAVQRLVHDGQAPETTTAVLLDFAKAYDTLDRPSVSAALERHGFPAAIVRAVDDMHLATTAKFLAGAELSHSVDVHNGIRQGCPFAAVLFVLTIDLLYKAAAVDTGLMGVQLDAQTRVTLAGYADNTTAFLGHPKDEPALLRLLAEFGDASGLRVNAAKCAVVCASRTGPTSDHASMTLPVMAADRHCRLLGFTIASLPSASYIWALTLQQLRATMHLAELKTTDVLQRAEIGRTVVMPKLLFVGRHAWPTSDTIEMLQRFLHNYVWKGTLATTTKPGRAWLSADIAALPVRDGGIGMPCVRDAFLRLSEKTVSRWASAGSTFAASIGRVLLRQAPSSAASRSTGLVRLQVPPVRLEATMAATGLAAIRLRLALPRHADEATLVQLLVRSAGRGGLAHHQWKDGWIYCHYSPQAVPLLELLRLQRDRHGHFSTACLLAAQATGSGILLAPAGRELRHRDCPTLLQTGSTIGEILTVEWCGDFHVRFHCATAAYPLSPRTALHFRRFCDVVVYNYPAILLPHNPTHMLQPRPPTLTRWRLEPQPSGHQLWADHGIGDPTDLGLVTTKRVAARRARDAGHAVVTFDPHPWIDAFAQIWNVARRIRAHSSSRPASPATQLVTAREAMACETDAGIGGALRLLSWHRIAWLPTSVSSQRLLMLKIKGQRLSGWARSLGSRGCPYCPGMGPDGGHTFHIVWHCPAAQAVWDLLLLFWRRLGMWRRDTPSDKASFRLAVFSIRLPWTPVGATPLVSPGHASATPAELNDLAHAVWAGQVLAAFQTIWNWRQGVADDDSPWTYPAARSALLRRLLSAIRSADRVIDALRHGAAQLRHLLATWRRFVTLAPLPHALPAPAHEYILFFDGGWRGNPGPGGSGAIVLRTDQLRTAPTLVWSAAMSLAAASTTNNQAEYLGLVTGLAAADRNNWRPISVVGDSMLIIRQLQHYRPPKNDILLRFYQDARRTADRLGVTRWSHHLRAYNKAADAAANVAMDTRRSIQTLHPTTRPEWAGLDRLMMGDFLHWLSDDNGP